MKLFSKRRPTVNEKYCVFIVTIALLLGSANFVLAESKDDPVLTKVLIDQLELRDTDESDLWVDGQAWVGKDLQKLWFKATVERSDGETKDAELQALYSQAITPFWDIQVGLRRDFEPTPSRSWAVIGVQGIAPYFFEIDTAFFIGERGRTALRLQVEYELLFTQRLILMPKIEINVYGQNDADLGIGSGLSEVELGLRLRYEIQREFAPYIGVNWNKRFGNTAGFMREQRKDISNIQWMLGVRIWF